MVVLVTLLAVAVGLLSVLVAGLLRSHAEMLRALDARGVDLDPNAAADRPPLDSSARPDGRAAADVSGVGPDGAPQHFAVVGEAHATLLAFLSTTCLTCRDFWTALGDHTLEAPSGARVIVVTRGVEAESPAAVRKLASLLVPTVMSTETWQAYDVPGAPYVVLVDGPRGVVVGEGTAATWERAQQMMRQAVVDGLEQ